jgi:hypothetical protein
MSKVRNEFGRGTAEVLLGLLVVVMALIFLLFVVRGLSLPFVSYDHGWSWTWMSLFHGAHPRLWGFTGFVGLLNLALAVWVAIDANRRQMSGPLWGILVFFTSIVGLVVYLLVVQMNAVRNGNGARAAPTAAPGAAGTAAPRFCRACGEGLQPGFRHCPYCGAAQGGGCPSCSRPVAADWKACPHCGARLTGGAGTAPEETSP